VTQNCRLVEGTGLGRGRNEQYLHELILVLFFFNAVLDRISVYYLGIRFFASLFYLLIGIALVLRSADVLATKMMPRPAANALLLLAVAMAAGIVYGDSLASFYGIKQFFFGVVFLFLFAASPIRVRLLVRAVTIVQCYALFQGVYFLLNAFTLPPWDMAFIQHQLESWGARNLYQDELIRPFATFSSFYEYEIVVHVTLSVLFICRKHLSQSDRRWMTGGLISLIAVDVMLPDRTPILMGLIVVVAGVLGMQLVGVSRGRFASLVSMAIVTGLVIASFVALPQMLSDAGNPGLRRLAEAFRFWEAETVQERVGFAWRQALEIVRANPEGLGPASVVTSLNTNAFVPHSTYFALAIGYSVFCPFVFFGMIGSSFKDLFQRALLRVESQARLGFCAIGLTAAFMAAGLFNASFSGYAGSIYFILMLWLRQLGNALSPQQPNRSLSHDRHAGEI
jgi:hypothetical protein